MAARCDHCRTRVATINIGISKFQEKTRVDLRCNLCFQVEQQISGREDWRDSYRLEYMQAHDMIQHSGETPINLLNRCKRLLMQSGFSFGASA